MTHFTIHTLRIHVMEQSIKSLQERLDRATKPSRRRLLTKRLNEAQAALLAFKLAN